MKKSLLLILLLPLTVFAQHEFGYHATWYFSYGGFGEFGYKKVSHVGDTSMLGMHWLEFEVTGTGVMKTGPNPDDFVADTTRVWNSIYLATKNDSVFRLLNDSTPYLLYDFSAGVGESWQFAPNDTFMGCDSVPIATVNEFGFDTIDGNVVEFMRVTLPMDTVYYGNTPYYQPMSNTVFNTRIYPDFGSNSYVLLFGTWRNACDGVTILDYGGHSLSCFSNDSLSISFVNQACDFVPFISVEEYESISFEVYPNPTDDLISIQADKVISKVEVYSLGGQKLIETSQTENIELPASSGIYVVAIYFEDGRRAVTKVVKK